jgi:ferrous iron transport protein B
MSSCCTQPEKTPTPKAAVIVALAGNPNCGKTTIFNALTGLRQKVANYPGVTVEKKTGRCKLPDGRHADVIDLPGTYSLISRSPDEQVAMEVLRGIRPPAPDVVVVVVDASNLQRNLYLVSQLVELGRPLVVALNMMDVAERRGMHVSPANLERQLGVPVVPVVGHKRRGVEELKNAILNARVAPLPDWPLPQAMKDELLVVGGGLAILHSRNGEGASGRNGEESENPGMPIGLGTPSAPRAWICREDDPRRLDRFQALAERLLIGDRAADVGDVAKSEPVAKLLRSAEERMSRLGIDPMQADIEAHYKWIETVAGKTVAGIEELAAMGTVAPGAVLPYEGSTRARTLSDRVDAVLVHKVWGMLVFAAIMGSLFVTIFWLAAPIMDFMKGGVEALGAFVAARLPDGPIRDLVNDGIFAGVGSVVVFVPQIAILFMFLAILEDSGYLARAAFLMDRVLSKVGLHGKSFIPLLSSFACAIPGILATRTIENRKDRLATILIAPFMSCSARLPVYTLLIGTFFAAYGAGAQAGIMLALYALGIVAAAGTAWVFKRSLMKGPPAAFILELPTYKVPQLSQVARTVYVNTKEFLVKAGTIIFCLSVILWAMTYYPRLPESKAEAVRQDAVRLVSASPTAGGAATTIDEQVGAAQDKAVAGEQLRYSIAGRFGHAIEPIIKPLGYDWKMGVGLVGSFAAREVFVSTMGIVYSAGDTEEGTTDLEAAMKADRHPDGRPVWTPLVAVSLLVWFVLAMQCMSTLAVVKRETGGWRWPLFMLAYMNGLAYVACFMIYQIGRAF